LNKKVAKTNFRRKPVKKVESVAISLDQAQAACLDDGYEGDRE
jgi:hypothetical protein